LKGLGRDFLFSFAAKKENCRIDQLNVLDVLRQVILAGLFKRSLFGFVEIIR